MTMRSNSKPFYGIALIVLAVFMMSIQDALFKYLSDDYPLWQIFSLRSLMTLPLFILVFRIQRQPLGIWLTALQPWALFRAFLFASSFVLLYASMPLVSLSTVAAGYYTAPIFVALLSVVFLGERIGLLGWLAVAVGFIGVIVILRPGSDAFSPWALLPVLGGFAYATANIVTRSKCQTMSVTALALALNITLLLIGLVASGLLLALSLSNEIISDFPFLLADWTATTPLVWWLLMALALLIFGIATCIARAYQIASPPALATFEYCYLIFVAVWDGLIFNTSPSGSTVLGIVLIVLSGVMVSRPSTNRA